MLLARIVHITAQFADSIRDVGSCPHGDVDSRGDHAAVEPLLVDHDRRSLATGAVLLGKLDAGHHGGVGGLRLRQLSSLDELIHRRLLGEPHFIVSSVARDVDAEAVHDWLFVT